MDPARALPGRQQSPGAVGEDHHLSGQRLLDLRRVQRLNRRRRDPEARLRIRRHVAQELAGEAAAQYGAKGQGQGHELRLQHVAQAPVAQRRRQARRYGGQGAGPQGKSRSLSELEL